MMDDIARRTISAMRADLTAYPAPVDIASLDRLVGRLSGAIDALTGRVDDDWLNEARSAWWPLEYVNANVLGDDRANLTSAEVAAVSSARDEFLALLAEY